MGLTSNFFKTVILHIFRAYGSLTVRGLLDMREQCLHNAQFTDIYLEVCATIS